jgi:hypothetical protein
MRIIKLSAVLLLAFLLASCEKKNPKAYQIVFTPDREYYTTFYTVDHQTNCIEFTSYDDGDSSRVKVCQPWDVKPNPDAE